MLSLLKAFVDSRNVVPLDQFSRSTRMAPLTQTCPGCGSTDIAIFYGLEQAPVHSVLLLPTSEAAINYKRGDIAAGFCQNCSFISNYAFNPGLLEYSSEYEATQGFSSTFNQFHKRLAESLIDRYGLHDKDIIEIGCGNGEFLTLLCELGNNRGIGFDPAYVSERIIGSSPNRITFIKDFFSEKYSEYQADFICCKMTLEHIHQTSDFMKTIRASISPGRRPTVFVQVPNISHILEEVGFWDIYYEHCSYFNPESLAFLFRSSGFEVHDSWTDYDGQYLLMTGYPADFPAERPMLQKEKINRIAGNVAKFSDECQFRLVKWNNFLKQARRNEQRLVIWGSGSKAVGFLTTLKIYEQIKYVVDINPYRQGSYSAGTGQEIVAPAFLKDYKPDIVIIMNPIYMDEIRQALYDMDLRSGLMTTII